jgi:hypothetical protein
MVEIFSLNIKQAGTCCGVRLNIEKKEDAILLHRRYSSGL